MPLIDGIVNYLQLGSDLATGGQPTADELRAVAEAGYEVVVNLAVSDPSTGALPEEAALVGNLGMEYVHIPVVWTAPTPADLKAFFAAMDRLAGRRVFVHCIANMRVSAFLFLDRVLRQGVPEDEARAAMLQIWEPDEIWADFIAARLAEPKA